MSQSDHNHNTSRYLEDGGEQYTDWSITTLFYSALHAANEYIDKLPNDMPNTHAKRKKIIANKLCDIYEDYCTLQDLSEKSRYIVESINITPKDKMDAIRYHKSIRKHIANRLKVSTERKLS